MMRRSWETIRTVLFHAEAGGGHTDAHHVDLLCQAGYLARVEHRLPRLTWKGHDLLDAIRDDDVWEGCRAAIAANGGGLPTEILLAVARANTAWSAPGSA